MSADPYIPDPSGAQDYNHYSYVDNNPLTYVDPSVFAAGDLQAIFQPDGGNSGFSASGNPTPQDDFPLCDGSDLPCVTIGGSSWTDPGAWWPTQGRSGGGSFFSGGPGAASPAPSHPSPSPSNPLSSPQKGQQNTQVTCRSVLPNGQTVGDVVASQRAQLQSVFDSTLQTEGGPLFAEVGTFAAIAGSHGPIDFKNNFAGQANASFLGSAGNFADYAIGSGYIPNGLLDFGAGTYAVTAAVFGPKPLSSLTGPMFSDASAAAVRNAALASNGCSP